MKSSGRAPHLPLATRRELVLDAALRVTLREGGAVSMESTAAEAGVAKTVLYRCFANREDMLAALYEREERRLTQELAAALAAAGPLTDPARSLYRVLVAYFTAVADAPDSYRLLYGPAPQPERLGSMDQARAEAAAHLSSVLTSWLDEAAGHPPTAGDRTAPVAAAMAVGVAEAGARLLLDDEQGWTPGELADMATELFARGVPGLARRR
ncbi:MULTISPECIES: TetR/AcrR family transcriptional regulator [unclassified Streptomyces]|uniref:TetR/AcrR family transcriptional regulator n=1 Tax=unclassified Streptomyces TaxID=2593676 RepID=UPI0003611BFF|nr:MULTISPECIES: TetR/AcrR family transcriptional regulator [unclassified Streptomyces]MYT27544.1 TetR family transcriptional regulator [Streptomyces sp. SID8354]